MKDTPHSGKFAPVRRRLVSDHPVVTAAPSLYGKGPPAYPDRRRNRDSSGRRPETPRKLGVSAHPPRSMSLRLGTSLRCVPRRKLLAGVDQKLNVVPTLNIRPCMIRVGASQEGPNVVVHDSAASVLKKL